MGESIADAGKEAEMITFSDNPFAFFALFDEFAQQFDKAPSFDPEASEYDKHWSVYYIEKNLIGVK